MKKVVPVHVLMLMWLDVWPRGTENRLSQCISSNDAGFKKRTYR